MGDETCYVGMGSDEADCTQTTRTEGKLESYPAPGKSFRGKKNCTDTLGILRWTV